MSKRVSPIERIRAEIDALFASDGDLASALEDVARLSVRLMMQAAIEAEVDEFLGRARYQRRGDDDRGAAQRLAAAHRGEDDDGPRRSCAASTRRSAPGCSVPA